MSDETIKRTEQDVIDHLLCEIYEIADKVVVGNWFNRFDATELERVTAAQLNLAVAVRELSR
jgi:hypothetical protein